MSTVKNMSNHQEPECVDDVCDENIASVENVTDIETEKIEKNEDDNTHKNDAFKIQKHDIGTTIIVGKREFICSIGLHVNSDIFIEFLDTASKHIYNCAHLTPKEVNLITQSGGISMDSEEFVEFIEEVLSKADKDAGYSIDIEDPDKIVIKIEYDLKKKFIKRSKGSKIYAIVLKKVQQNRDDRLENMMIEIQQSKKDIHDKLKALEKYMSDSMLIEKVQQIIKDELDRYDIMITLLQKKIEKLECSNNNDLNDDGINYATKSDFDKLQKRVDALEKTKNSAYEQKK